MADELRNQLRGQVHENYPLAPHTTYRIGGPSDIAIFPRSISDLSRAITLLHQHSFPITVLGGGSNVLVSDRGVRGAVIFLNHFNQREVNGTAVIADAGIPSHQVAVAAQAASLTGAEFLTWLPGSIGGACYMNARAYGGEISNIVSQAKVITPQGDIVNLIVSPDQFSYKQSLFQNSNNIIVEVTLTLKPGQPSSISEKMAYIEAERRTKHQMDYPSCGCVFKNDPQAGISAGKLIEECSLKGFRIGDAQISPYHANFIINLGQATADQVYQVIEHIRKIVADKTQNELSLEVRLVGDWN